MYRIKEKIKDDIIPKYHCFENIENKLIKIFEPILKEKYLEINGNFINNKEFHVKPFEKNSQSIIIELKFIGDKYFYINSRRENVYNKEKYDKIKINTELYKYIKY